MIPAVRKYSIIQHLHGFATICKFRLLVEMHQTTWCWLAPTLKTKKMRTKIARQQSASSTRDNAECGARETPLGRKPARQPRSAECCWILTETKMFNHPSFPVWITDYLRWMVLAVFTYLVFLPWKKRENYRQTHRKTNQHRRTYRDNLVKYISHLPRLSSTSLNTDISITEVKNLTDADEILKSSQKYNSVPMDGWKNAHPHLAIFLRSYIFHYALLRPHYLLLWGMPRTVLMRSLT